MPNARTARLRRDLIYVKHHAPFLVHAFLRGSVALTSHVLRNGSTMRELILATAISASDRRCRPVGRIAKDGTKRAGAARAKQNPCKKSARLVEKGRAEGAG